MVRARLEALRNWAEDDAQNCIFPFWTSDFIVDHEHGGFYGLVTLDMQRDNSEPRGLTLTGRMLYAFSTAYRVFGDEIYRQKAEYTFRDICSRFYDPEYGGAFISVSAEGEVLDDSKPNYCEAFLIMGCAAYHWATGDAEALRIAMETFDIMESRCKFAPASYYGSMNRRWEQTAGMGFGGKKRMDMPEGTVMFPHHLCQSYVQLYHATGDGRVRAALHDMAVFMAERLYDPQYHNLKTMVAADDSRVGSRQSFGHDCEISYLAMNVCALLGDEALTEKMKAVVVDVLRHVLEHDFDPYGCLYNGGDLLTGEKEPVHVWWAQAEAVTAMLCGFELTGDERFLAACEKQAAAIEKYFVNREHGDWYNNILVDEDGGHISDGMHGKDKLNSGKCPFHNSQMCFEVMERTERLISKGE